MADTMTRPQARPTASAQAPRFKVRFRDPAALAAALAVESPATEIQVANRKRAFLGVQMPRRLQKVDEAVHAFDRQLLDFETYYGAEIVEDYRYDLEAKPGIFQAENFLPEGPDDPSLDDVLERIHAPDAWKVTRGRGIAIAVVDTGIDGSRPEFPPVKRLGSWQPVGDLPWTDYEGHGTMCACIAAATRSAGGVFDGVAPEAGLIACRTRFFDTELTTIYDYLIGLVEVKALRIVATNSFGIQTGTAPPEPANSDFEAALQEAIDKGIVVCFSAGNYHELAGGVPDECTPSSIWLHKSRADLLTVATCQLDGRMWSYSSRGPGQRFGEVNTRQKPDVTAPTPENGRILYGGDVVTLAQGWGTSGACPQSAGLAALLLAKKGALSRGEVFDAIRSTSAPLGHEANCEGAGLIDCAEAVASV